MEATILIIRIGISGGLYYRVPVSMKPTIMFLNHLKFRS